MTSKHYNSERVSREYLIDFGIGLGHVVNDFVINRGHKDGPEIHSITDTGIILIHNQKSGKMVTKLIARPGQIARYYLDEGRIAPQSIMDIAREHQKKGYNHI